MRRIRIKGVNDMKEYAFGIDLGGTTAKVGLFTTSGKLLEKWEVSTDTSNNGAHILENLAAAVQQKMQEKGLSADEVEGVGLGVPGPVLDSSIVPIVCANLGGWGNRNVSIELSELLGGIRVLVGNDANVAALGEIWMGAAQGCRSAVMVTLGTGVGGGVIINGKVFSGTHGVASEIGHMIVVAGGEQCTCGNRGCWERYASATAIIREARKYARLHPDCEIARAVDGDLDKITAKTVIDLAKAGAPDAAELFDSYVQYLCYGLVNLINLYDPEIIALGGGVSGAGEFLLNAVRAKLPELVFYKSMKYARIELARLGNDAGIIGAAMLGR